MKTCELEGAALDYWVARAEGKNYAENKEWGNATINDLGRCSIAHRNWNCAKYFEPSKNWGHGGPIIERERITAEPHYPGGWFATNGGADSFKGPTLLIAAMRCYVASKFGDEVPAEEGDKA